MGVEAFMRRPRGFTLIELMIVVAILVILASIAVTAYKRYMARARATEVYAVFADIRAKEEAYRAEYGAYLNISASEVDFYPALLTNGTDPVPKNWAPPNANSAIMGVRPPANH